MNWTRERPGTYTSGPYLVEKINAPTGEPAWYTSGPEVGGPHYLKTEAQRVCEKVAARRAAPGTRATVEPVVGDVVDCGRVGRVTAVLRHDECPPVYCIRFPRGKRVCLRRNEFMVVIP